jgi:hypothetical protein
LIAITAANPTRPESSDLRADKEDERLAITAAGVSAGIYGLSEWQKACYHNSCSTWYCPNWICSAGRIDKALNKKDERAIAITAAGVSAGIYGLSEYQKACYNQGCYAWWCPNWVCSSGRNDAVRANEQNEYQDCLEKAGNNAFPKDIEDCLHMSHMEFIGMGDLMAGCMDEEFTTLEEMETEVAECLGEEIPERVDGEDRFLFSGTVVGATSWYVTCKTSHCASWWCPSSLC